MNNKNIKKIICGLLAFLMVVSCFNIQSIEAATYSKKQLQSLQKETEKNVKQYKSKWETEKKKYKKQTKGTTPIWGDIVSGNPLIVYDTLERSYYWITNSKNMVVGFTAATGHVKKTGQYKKYNGITCAVAKAVKVTANPSKYEEKYKTEKQKLTEIKYALKNTFTVYYDENDAVKNNDTVLLHNDEEICAGVQYKYDTEYSTIKYTIGDGLNVKSYGNTIDITAKDDAEIGKETGILFTDTVSGKKVYINITIVGPYEDDYRYEDLY